ncbi:MAG: PEP-CTERM sorting domain-containing protein, partial [Gammaproteobacteria bacterium]|nr:PEP-CTERM sorting domain-containing protein [Gammaproteobacteria bacterium]
LSAGDRFVFNLSGDLDAPRNPVAFLPFDIELTSGATTDTAGVIVSADGAYQILFSSFSGIDFSDIDGIKLLSTNSGVLSPDLALSALEVQVVPVPAAVWMFGSALGLLGWVRRRSAIL